MSKHSMTKVSAKHGGGKKGKLRHVSIRPAANGVTVEAAHDGEKGPMLGDNSEPMVFTKHKDAVKHVSDLLAPHFGAGKTEGESPAEEKDEEAGEAE